MLRDKLRFRRLSCLMAGMFAMQVLVSAFCLLTSEAHAMPMAQHGTPQSAQIDAHCAKAEPLHEQQTPHHSGSCYHCDQPDELSNSSFSSLAQVAVLLPAIVSVPALRAWGHDSGLLSTRVPTGPPRSSTLLYTTSQRIRI